MKIWQRVLVIIVVAAGFVGYQVYRAYQKENARREIQQSVIETINEQYAEPNLSTNEGGASDSNGGSNSIKTALDAQLAAAGAVSWRTLSTTDFTLAYPAELWRIQDLTYEYQGQKYIVFWIHGPYRSDLPGANGQEAAYAQLVCYDETRGLFISICNQEGREDVSFNYRAKPGDQAVTDFQRDINYIKATPEYGIGQLILGTAGKK